MVAHDLHRRPQPNRGASRASTITNPLATNVWQCCCCRNGFANSSCYLLCTITPTDPTPLKQGAARMPDSFSCCCWLQAPCQPILLWPWTRGWHHQHSSMLVWARPAATQGSRQSLRPHAGWICTTLRAPQVLPLEARSCSADIYLNAARTQVCYDSAIKTGLTTSSQPIQTRPAIPTNRIDMDNQLPEALPVHMPNLSPASVGFNWCPPSDVTTSCYQCARRCKSRGPSRQHRPAAQGPCSQAGQGVSLQPHCHHKHSPWAAPPLSVCWSAPWS